MLIRMLALWSLVVSFSAQAQSLSSLTQEIGSLLQSMDETYQTNGHDNNWITIKEIYNPNSVYYAVAPNLSRELGTEDEQISGLIGCALLQQGAYGPHFSPEQAQDLAQRTVRKLNSLHSKDVKIELYQLEGVNIEYDVFNSPCTLRVDLYVRNWMGNLGDKPDMSWALDSHSVD